MSHQQLLYEIELLKLSLIRSRKRGDPMKPNPECPICHGTGYPPDSKHPCNCWRVGATWPTKEEGSRVRPRLKCVMPKHVVLERLGGGGFQETTEPLIRAQGLMYSWPTVGRPFRIIIGLTRAYETRRVISKHWEEKDTHMIFSTPDSWYEVTLSGQ